MNIKKKLRRLETVKIMDPFDFEYYTPMQVEKELSAYEKKKKEIDEREKNLSAHKTKEIKEVAHNLAKATLRNRKARGRSPTFKPVTKEEFFLPKTPPRLRKQRTASTPPWVGSCVKEEPARKVSRSRSKEKPRKFTSLELKERARQRKQERKKRFSDAKKMAMKKKTPVKKSRSSSRSRSSVGAANLSIVPSARSNAATINSNLRGILYPHSNTKPRHMDGATNESQTRYVRAINQLSVLPGDVGMIIMSPIATTLYSSRPGAAGTVGSVIADLNEIGIDSSGIAATTGIFQKLGDVDRWRVVSRGMKLSLLNTTDTNDGWFESFRVTSDPGVDEMQINDSPTANQAFLTHEATYFNRIALTANTSAQRLSYHADSVKNIGNFYFRLNPYAEEHPFIDINASYNISSTAVYVPGPPKVWQPNGADTQSYRPLIDHYLDPTYDSLCILIHGGASGTNVLIDAVSNDEVIYENSSQLARFHSKTTAHIEAQRRAHRLASSHHSAALGIA